MSVLTPGTTFSNGEQLTASDLNLLLQGATFTQSSVDNQSTQLVGTAIVVADGGIIAAKLDADAVTTSKIKDAEVTFAKLTDVIDDDTMDTATDITLATSESIKAYVDSNGITQTTSTAPYYGCRAFASFNGKDANPITPIASGNVASITRLSPGGYKIILTTALPTNCAIVASAGHNILVLYGNSVDVVQVSTTEIRIVVAQDIHGPFNPEYVAFSIFG